MVANARSRSGAVAVASMGTATAPWRSTASRYRRLRRAALSGSGWSAATISVTTTRGADPAAGDMTGG